MSSELTVTPTMPPMPTDYQRTTSVVPLNYETPAGPTSAQVTTLKLIVIAVRRLCLGAGAGCLTGGIIVLNVPSADEQAICIGMGIGLIVAAIPLPKRWF